MKPFEEQLNAVIVDTYRSILKVEETILKRSDKIDLSISEIHMLEAVGRGKDRRRTISELAEEMNITLDKTGFNYSRFVTHMYYLLDRSNKVLLPSTENQQMFDTLVEKYPKAYHCALLIQDELNSKLNDEELLYLIIHINRLCTREDCNR